MENRLKEIRKSLNITGVELAKKVGVSHSLIYMIEGGYRNPSMKIAKKIAKTLGKSLDEIFFTDIGHKTLPNSDTEYK